MPSVKNLMKIGQSVSKKTFKDYNILYMYIAQGQGQITPGDKTFVVTKSVCYFDHNCKFQPLVFNTF